MDSEPEYTVQFYKRKFDRELRHVKAALMLKKGAMTKPMWVRYVMATKKNILTNPSSFLRSVPEEKILKSAIDKVFQGFMEDQKIRDAQKRI